MFHFQTLLEGIGVPLLLGWGSWWMRPDSSEHSLWCAVNYEVPRMASGSMHSSPVSVPRTPSLPFGPIFPGFGLFSHMHLLSLSLLRTRDSADLWWPLRRSLLTELWSAGSPGTELFPVSATGSFASWCSSLKNSYFMYLVLFFPLFQTCVQEQLFFCNNFRLQKNCKDSSENIYTPHSVTSNVNILNCHGTLVQTKTIMSIDASLLTTKLQKLNIQLNHSRFLPLRNGVTYYMCDMLSH